MARAALRVLDGRRDSHEPVSITVPDGQVVPIPHAATEALMQILQATAQGEETATLPLHAELTTGQAAALMGVSRPHLVKLLDEARIEYRNVGTHRRVRMSSLLHYMQQDQADRRAALDELSRETFELGLT